MLKPPHDYAWGHTLFLGELTDRTFAIGSRSHILLPMRAGHKKKGLYPDRGLLCLYHPGLRAR